MLSPADLSPKATAPSIYSVDSGYGSNSVLEEEAELSLPHPSNAGPSNGLPQAPYQPVGLGLGGLWNVGDCIQPKRKEPAIDPIVTRFSVYTTKDNSGHDFYLPEIPHENTTCIEYEIWKITNPGENKKCKSCRLPEIIEPIAFPVTLPGSDGPLNGKESRPRLDIPVEDEPKVEPGDVQGTIRHSTRCSACELSALVDPSGSRFCANCSPDATYLSPVSPGSPHCTIRRSRAGRNSKLPTSALNRLQAWLDANQDNPYPSSETKRLLAQECGITEKQVTTWFTNARARQLNSAETYSPSSSEDETKENDMVEPTETPVYSAGGFAYISDNTPVGQQPRARAASIATVNAFSPVQSRARPSRRGKKKDYRRNTASTLSPQTPTLLSPSSPVEQPQSDQEMWQCTFCRKSMVPKSWRRHEETQHRPKAQWTCMLYGPRLSYPARSDSASACAFCMVKNPTEEHFLHHHRIEDCAKRDITDRTFFRPDHLRQHIKNFHNASLFDIVQARWKRAAEAGSEGWICGFCGERLDTWDKRETHIANHFKDGLTMASWKEYPDMDKLKKGKSKQRNEKDQSHGLGRRICRIGSPTTRQPSTESYQLPPQPTFTNAFEPLPAALPFTTMSQAPTLPDIPNISPLMNVAGNYVDWSAIHTSMEPQLQYPIPPTNTNPFDPSLENASLQQDFDSTLNMDLYSNPMDFHGPWDQPDFHQQPQHPLQQAHPHPHPHQQQHQNQHPHQHQHPRQNPHQHPHQHPHPHQQ